MSLPDTAEYWWDAHKNYGGNMFRHAKGVECGHNHNIMDTIYIEDVECRACIKIITEDKPEGLLLGKAPETYYMSHKEKKDRNKKKKFIEQYGICPCGCNWQIRKNKTSRQEFLGCVNYPKCKNTKSIQKSV